MNKRTSIMTSMVLIALGLLVFAVNVARWVFGFHLWQLWPLVVVAIGWAFVLPPLLTRGKRGLGAFFIPGLPILTTGTLLLLQSIFHWWDVWSWLWPWEVIGVALGFLFAALYMKVVWLLIPAILIGANGLLFQFCAITGWWEVWSVLWIIEPLSIGMALLYIHTQKPARKLRAAGITLCVLAGLGFIESAFVVIVSAFMPVWWLWRWMWPVTLIIAGGILLILGARRTETSALAAGR